jgi:hypothetical protein
VSENPAIGAAKPHVLYIAGRLKRRSTRLGRLLGLLRRDLELSVARFARERLFVHAGAVGWRGRAILLPGHTHAGKSTLVAALLKAGATYLSDEYALLDEHGRVSPYPRPLSLRCPGGGRIAAAPEGLGDVQWSRSLPVGGVVITRFRPGRRWRPRAAAAGEGILGLLAHTVAARDRPLAAFAVLKRVVTGATVLVGDRGEAADTARMLLTRFDFEESHQ